MHHSPPSHEFLVARARRFIDDFMAGEIEELAEYLADAGFSDVSQACKAIRSSLVAVIEELRSQREIEKAVAVEALLGRFDAAWPGW